MDARKETSKAIRATSDDFIDWQKEQLFAGKKKTGGNITPFYKPVTKRIKKRKGQPTDRVTLKDKGDLYDGIFVDVGLFTYRIYSTDSKADALTKKYGNDIWGLGKSFKKGYIQMSLQRRLVTSIKNLLKV